MITALNAAYSSIRLEAAADIMSTKIGFSVKGLSKDLQEATGHSISFQEAMQFSAMGLSAGLTAKQITNLTVIAKGAANALGRDMGDAVRRIVQGTAKQEQEILDELGIFVRAKTAYAEYAKKIGVEGVNALTATQRVQAYADAVSNAGEKWKSYAALEDPFSKFTSKLKESGLALLVIVNSIVTPIINLLSASESMIKGLLVLITASLLKKALPHLSDNLKGAFSVSKDELNRYDALKKTRLANEKDELEGLHRHKAALVNERRELKQDVFKDVLGEGPVKSKTLKADLRTLAPGADIGIVKAKVIDSINKQLNGDAKLIENAYTRGMLNEKREVRDTYALKLAKEHLAVEELTLQVKREEALIAKGISHQTSKIVALEDAAHPSQVGRKILGFKLDPNATANLQHQNTIITKIKDNLIATDLDVGTKISGTFRNLGIIVSGTTGGIAKFLATFKMLGVVGSIAIRGILNAMGPLMLLWTAWELILKPSLYIMGVFSKHQDKIDEANEKLAESAIHASAAMKDFNKNLAIAESGESAIKILEQRVQSILAIKAEIDKVREEIQRTKVEKEPGRGVNAQGKDISGIQLGVRALLEGETQATISKSAVLTELLAINKSLIALESERTQLSRRGKTENEEFIKREETLNKRASDATEKLSFEKQRLASRITAIIEPSNAASKALGDYLAKLKGTPVEGLNALGLVNTEIQNIYSNQELAINKLLSEVDPSAAANAKKTIFANMESDLIALGLSSVQTSSDISFLLEMIVSKGAGAETAVAALLFKAMEMAKVAQEKSAKFTAAQNAANITTGRAGEVLTGLNLEAKKEGEKFGFLKRGTIEKIKHQELIIAELEYKKALNGSDLVAQALAGAKLRNKKEEIN